LPVLLFSLAEQRTMRALMALQLTFLAVVSMLPAPDPTSATLIQEIPNFPKITIFVSMAAHYVLLNMQYTELQRQQKEYRTVAQRSLAAERSARQATHRAEAANRSKDEFVAIVSHEIRTPLNGVLGMAELLRASSLNAKQREQVATLIRSGEFLRMIINDILDFSKIVASQMDLEEVRFYPTDLVEQSLDLLSASASERDLALCVDLDDSGEQELLGDPVRIRQILMNLVNNSIKFTQEGFVETRLRVVPEAGHVTLILEVEDSGIGIAEKHRKNIFQPFFQTESSFTRRFGGTGLGLTICHQLATMMHGSLTFTSQVGRGTTFRFSAPFRRTGERREPRRLPAVSIVVATPTARRTASLVRTLSRMGAVVTTRSAFDRDRQEAPDLVLVDVSLSAAPLSPTAIAAELGVPIRRVVELRSRDNSRDEIDAHYPCTPSVLSRVLRNALRDGRRRSDSRLLTQLTALRAVPPPPARFVGLHALVAEDIQVNQMVIEGFLKQLGVSCDMVADGLAACETFDPARHQIVFMDLSMPKLDGTEASARIRARWAGTHDVHIIATTAHATDEAILSGLNAGFRDYLTKPLELAGFVRVLRALFPEREVPSAGTSTG
jgi:two-component system sensor histidine kinase/response regulator